jgi:hypothetical protein
MEMEKQACLKLLCFVLVCYQHTIQMEFNAVLYYW